MKSESVPAVVLGLGVNGLGVVRSLGQLGIPVIGVYTGTAEAGRVSKYCKAFRLPQLENNEEVFLKDLIAVGKEYLHPVIFSTSDKYLSFISRHRDILARHFRFVISSMDVIESALSKNGNCELARKAAVPTPLTVYSQSREDIHLLYDKMKFPCIVKPMDTFSINFLNNAKNKVFHDHAELLAFYDNNRELLGKTVIQEIVRGGDGNVFICSGYFNGNSEPLAMCTMRKIHQYLPDYGITCLGESVDIPELKDMTKDFMKIINFQGIMSAEYLYDLKSNRFLFVELNARSCYPNQLFTDAGVNISYVAYMDALRKHSAPSVQRNGIQWLDFQHDLSSCWRKYTKKEIGWLQWLRGVIGAESYAYWDSRDIKPFFYSLLLFGKMILGQLSCKLYKADF